MTLGTISRREAEPALAREKAVNRETVSEKLVSSIWRSQTFNRDRLVTYCGRELQIVYPGRPCSDHGPDFRDAIIALDNDLRRGDVEVHCRASDWRAHGHHIDPRYGSVILHVVFDVDTPQSVIRVDGQPVPALEIRPRLLIPLSEIEGLLSRQPHTSPCPGAAANRRWKTTLALIEQAGEERFRDRVDLIEGALCTGEPAQVFYELLLEALGYSQNKAPFRELARVVPFRLLEDTFWSTAPEFRRETVQALLFGGAGLLPSQRRINPPNMEPHPYLSRLESRWADYAEYVGAVSTPWRFSRVRPDNFPTRRIVAASEVLCSCFPAGLVETFTGLFREQHPVALPQRLTSMLCLRASDDYWQPRFEFCGRETGRDSQLIGRNRASVIAVNAVLPFIAALARQLSDGTLYWQALDCYRHFSALGENELTRYVAGLLRLPSQGIQRGAAPIQQGLLHIYRNWCIDKNCADCPVH